MVRIHFPPAESPSLSPSCFRGSRTPAFCAAARGWLGDRVGRDAAEGYKIAPTGGNISVAPYSSTAAPLMGGRRECQPVPIKSGRSPSLIVRWICVLGPGSTKAQYD